VRLALRQARALTILPWPSFRRSAHHDAAPESPVVTVAVHSTAPESHVVIISAAPGGVIALVEGRQASDLQQLGQPVL
jgi:hypothetical protein